MASISLCLEQASRLAFRTQELEIVSIDAAMHEMLGWPSVLSSNPDHSLPSSVHDLLPADIRGIHRRLPTQNHAIIRSSSWI